MYREFVGLQSNPVKNVVEAGAVRRFAEAIGDLNPLYFDEDAAARSRWGRRIAPPTFPCVFDYGTVEAVQFPSSGVIHAEQQYEYTRPLFVGEELLCYGRFLDTYEKRGRGGSLTFLVFERVAEDAAGRQVMRSREVYVFTQPVVAEVRE